MTPEILETSKELSPIIVAAIAAIAGLISGVIASLVSPWVHHAVETRRKSIEYKINLIDETRKLLDTTETIAEIRTSSLWGFISENLNEQEKKNVFPGAIVIEISDGGQDDDLSQDDHRKSGISYMLSRLEKEWKLT